jgi:phosphopantothenoylcysteine decarboxylase/phosphopantothenate--cysteine ligase
VKTDDILKALGSLKQAKQLLVGFALETNNEVANAQQKLLAKNADLIVLNSLRNKEAGFGVDTNEVTIFGKEGILYESGVKTKEEIAVDIVNTVIQKIYGPI